MVFLRYALVHFLYLLYNCFLIGVKIFLVFFLLFRFCNKTKSTHTHTIVIS